MINALKKCTIPIAVKLSWPNFPNKELLSHIFSVKSGFRSVNNLFFPFNTHQALKQKSHI